MDFRRDTRSSRRSTPPAEAAFGTDHRNGVSFDHQGGSPRSGCTGCDVMGAYAGVTRHVAKNAESIRTRNLAWQSSGRTGRPGVRACRVWRGGQGHRQFLAADRHGPQTGWPDRQDEAPRRKLLAVSGSEPGANASPLFKEPAARISQHDGWVCSRVGWTIPATHAKTNSLRIEHPIRTSKIRLWRMTYRDLVTGRSNRGLCSSDSLVLQ